MTKTSETSQTNPLREGLATRAVPQACTVVGATGDLTMRKLIPALYNIAADGELRPALTVVGFARRRMPTVALRRSVGCSRSQIAPAPPSVRPCSARARLIASFDAALGQPFSLLVQDEHVGREAVVDLTGMMRPNDRR